MSAFVVDDETINKVVSFLYAKANGPDDDLSLKHTKLVKIGYDPMSRDGCKELANKMFDMNVAAVNAKYGEGAAEQFRPLDFKFLFVPSSQIKVIKALESWLYQCLEGRIPSLQLYGAMEEIRDILCVDVVHNLEEYEAAIWD